MSSTGSKKFAKINNMITGLGAAVVIVGAMFKINHWPFASTMLVVGLSTEAIIFIMSAFAPVHEEVNWALVYPELAGGESEEDDVEAEEEVMELEQKTEKPIVQQLDDMLKQNNVDSDVLENLGKGLASLSSSVSGLVDITDASVATNEYASKVKNASNSMSEFTNSYEKAVDAISNLSNVSASANEYQQQITDITRNLGSLNAVYELELQDSNNHIKALNKFYGSMTDAMSNMTDVAAQSNEYKAQLEDLNKNLSNINSGYSQMGASVENMMEVTNHTEEYKQQMQSLNKNLSSLNSVYGNMLSAMGQNG